MSSPDSDPFPLVSIVTPTWPGRWAELLDRCIPSVLALDWPAIQHVIVSDRTEYHAVIEDAWNEQRDIWGAGACGARPETRYLTLVEINETWRNPTSSASTGSYPWMIGSRLAMGAFVGFLGDDDELLPHHVTVHVAAMREAETMFSISKTEFRVGGEHYCVIGQSDWAPVGSLDSTGIMCSVDALRHGIWDANGVNSGDHQMVQAWLAAGLRGTFVDDITGIHHDGWAAGKSGRPDKPS